MGLPGTDGGKGTTRWFAPGRSLTAPTNYRVVGLDPAGVDIPGVDRNKGTIRMCDLLNLNVKVLGLVKNGGR